MVNCPICHKPMEFNGGAYFCTDNMNTEQSFAHQVVVLCKCSHRMKPIPTYSTHEGTWKFWECPHCFNKR